MGTAAPDQCVGPLYRQLVAAQRPLGLDKRISIRDFDEIRDVVEMIRHDTGKRDRTDPSYAVLHEQASPGNRS